MKTLWAVIAVLFIFFFPIFAFLHVSGFVTPIVAPDTLNGFYLLLVVLFITGLVMLAELFHNSKKSSSGG
ncbi:MAG: hypothetical protein Q8R36_02125 [bacterium]|nr:hypothetical protein [bacterium]